MKETEEFSFSKKWGTLQPKFIIALVAILAFLGVAAGYFEISQSRQGIMELLREEAETVTDALAISAEIAVQTYAEVESLVEDRLFDTAQLLIHLQSENGLNETRLQSLLNENQISCAFEFDPQENSLDLIFPRRDFPKFELRSIKNYISPLIGEEGKYSKRISGILEDVQGHAYYAAALRKSNGGIWVLCADSQILLDFRKRVGMGKLIQDIGENREIAYIVLQDTTGIISATKNISSMPTLSSDTFLQQALSRNRLLARVTTLDGEDVFEVVKPFTVEGETFGLIRVALSMQAANQEMTRTMQRAVVVLFGFIVVGVILFNFLLTNQNYRLLTNAYSKIKTYTGNILENMADAVVAVNKEGQITLFNRAAEKLFGRESEQVLGKSCGDIIAGQTSLLDQALAHGKGVRDQEVEYHLNGHKSVLAVTTNVLRNDTDEIDSAVAVIKDLTEKKVWEERLRRQEKLTAMGELASGVAHEVRNPLNSISMIVQRFNFEFTPVNNEQEYRELANTVVVETKRVNDIIERFLQFARPPALNLQKHDLRDVLRKALKLVESQAKEQKVAITVNATEPLELNIDANQMEQVFLNLLQNSLHATPKGGTITVRAYKNEREAILEINDTGKGIPPEHLHRIFDLYFTTKETGTGMGLSVSDRIVSEHGGRIEVESELGKSSKFTIFLPLE